MTEEEIREKGRACDGKTPYDTRDKANRVRNLKRQFGNNVYRCRFCENFHIGHPPAELRNRKHG